MDTGADAAGRRSLLQQPGGCTDPGWTTLWVDNFDTLGTDNWGYQQYDGWQYNIGDWGNGELAWYTNRSQNVRVEGGNLVLQAQRESGEGLDWLFEECWGECRDRCALKQLDEETNTNCVHSCAWPRCDYVKQRGITSGRVRTFGKLAVAPSEAFPVVRIEARVQVPQGAGLWPAFWLLPEQGASQECSGCGQYGGWPMSGELDIMETCNEALVATGTAHYGGPGELYASSSSSAPLGSGFQTFAIEWERDEVRWYLDGQQYHQLGSRNSSEGPGWYSAAAEAGPTAPFDVPFYLVFNLAVGGWFTGVDLPAAQVTLDQGAAQMLVDWVQVCAQRATPPVPVAEPPSISII